MLRVFGEIRDAILELTSNREEAYFREVVDLDFIRQQAEQGLYYMSNCRRLVASIVEVRALSLSLARVLHADGLGLLQAIQRTQAPKRDGETRAMWAVVEADFASAADASAEDTDAKPRAICKALEFLLGRVNAMRIDAANTRLRLIALVIKDHGVDYERGKFEVWRCAPPRAADALTYVMTGQAQRRHHHPRAHHGNKAHAHICASMKAAHICTYPQEWLHKAAKREVCDTKAVDLNELIEGTARAFVGIHTADMLHLVTSAGDAEPGNDTMPLLVQSVPETLAMDLHRLNDFRYEFQTLATATSMLVTAAHELQADAPALLPRIAEQVFVVPMQQDILYELDLETSLEPTAGILLDGMQRGTIEQRKARIAVIMQRLRAVASPTDAVHRMM